MKKIILSFLLAIAMQFSMAQPSSTPQPWAYRWTQLNDDTGGQYYRYIPLPAVGTTCINFLSGMSTDTSMTDQQRQRLPGCYDIGDGIVVTGNTIDTQVKMSTLSGYAPVSSLSSYLTIANATATYYPLSNPSGYVTQAGARSSFSLTTTGSGQATYNPTTGVLNVPTPSSATIINRAVVVTATDGTYSWTFPTACTGTPAVAVTPQNNTSAEVINHKITSVNSTSVSISLSRAVLTLNGLLGLTIPVIQTSPSAQTVHLIAICP